MNGVQEGMEWLDEREDGAGGMTEEVSDAPVNPWGLDLDDPIIALRLTAERLSLVRYVFVVQIEDGIATAGQRASLEYADAVLIGWPDEHAKGLDAPTDEDRRTIDEQIRLMEEYVDKFRTMEQDGDIDGMTDTLIRITERVARVRSIYQPKFLLPTFAEIRRVVQDEWDEDMGKIDSDTVMNDNGESGLAKDVQKAALDADEAGRGTDRASE